MSLRSRLVASFIAIALALIGADIAVTLIVRTSLVSNVDRRLEFPRGGPRPDIPASTTTPAPVTRGSAFSEFYLAFIGSDGTITGRPNTVGRNVNPPKITAAIAARATPVGATPRPFNLSAQGGGSGYRAVVFHSVNGGVVVIAVSLKETIDTVNRVVLVEVLATLLVLMALAFVAWWVLHLGVRPLDQMTQTAEAIASGDLSRRVDRAEHHTEVGRLGVALNKMLGEIEESFDERRLSEERLRRFVADASHELRTPLTSIRGYAELWRQGGLRTESELADAMRRMEQEGARMGLLVDDMLLLARLDQGRPLEVGPVDLVGLVNDTVTDARAVEPSRPISVATSVDGPLVVDGDESRLHQVLNNILANVRDHTPPGTPTHVTLGAADGVASVVVSDDGPGFGAEPERVFERFYRADPARSRAHGSSGLGLSIVASLVAAHGGEVSAGASASGGAEVRVSLPLASRIATSPPAADAPSTPAAAASEQFA